MKTKHLLQLAAFALIPAITPLPSVHAASTLVFKVVTIDGERRAGPTGRIYAGPDAMMTLGGHGWRSVTDAREVARRLNSFAEQGILPQDIELHRERRTHVITARGKRVLQIDHKMARVHRSTPGLLAREWAENLQAKFGQPYLSVPPILVPIGENRTAPVRGNPVGQLTVRADTPVVTVAYDAADRLVRVFGLEPGRTELVVADAHSSLRVPVRAAKYAARIAGYLSASVTGNPAPSELIARAAKAAIRASLALEPGAWAAIRPTIKRDTPLGPGRSLSVPVRVSAAGEDYLSYHARPTVLVQNQVLPQEPVDVLLVSNSPERLLAHGLWFEGTLQDFQSARLLFHHVNGSGAAGDIVVELWNLGDETARVHVVYGLGGPTPDESWAGHRAATQFLANRALGAGWIIRVPPNTAAPALSRPITTGATLSGLIELRALDPGAADLRVRVFLSPPRAERMPHPITQYSPSPFLGRWQYPEPRRELAARYVVGRDWAFITIGDPATPGLIEGDHLAGNYGIIYDITLELDNPTAEEVPVVLYLEPGGGPARGALLIDGSPVDAAVIARDSEAELARYLLAPGERRRVFIETIPQGGSNYPVRLVARAI